MGRGARRGRSEGFGDRPEGTPSWGGFQCKARASPDPLVKSGGRQMQPEPLMRFIDPDTWPRRQHFQFFQNRRNPCFSLTVQMDVTQLVAFRKAGEQSGVRFTDYIYYAIVKSVNETSEFRMRLVNRCPVEFCAVNGAFTYMPKNCSAHANCIAAFDDMFSVFSHNIQEARNAADNNPSLTPEGGESQALVYMTCLPNVTFTALTNPWGDPWEDSVPRIAFGKFDSKTGLMPVSVEVLHSFIDGVHMTSFLECMAGILANPSQSFSS